MKEIEAKDNTSYSHRFRSPINAQDAVWLSNLMEELILTASRMQERSKNAISPFAYDNVEDILDMLIDLKVDIDKTEVRDGKD